MKKILVICLLVLPLGIYAQSGSGTAADPYYGTISTSVTWDPDAFPSGTVYVGTPSSNDLAISSGGHLEIWPGTTIIFTQTTSDLAISGTGQITAAGEQSNVITFTKNPLNSNWGHVIFDGMTGSNPSLLQHCVFEYGRLTGTTLVYANAGGGVCANYSYVTIQDCLFENNYALFGGALFIGAGQNPTVRRCYFKDNTSREAGGGVYIYNQSAVVIENCIFEGNYADGVTTTYYGGGGVQFGASTPNARVINSTFVNNTADRGGDGVYFYASGSVVNCIFWGAGTQVKFRTSYGTASYCAIQGYTPSFHLIDCFNLNQSNSAADGPNFIAVDGSDWSVKFISPCRDSGTSSGAPSSDFASNLRIGDIDIGAYEVQYSLWTGSSGSSWSTPANWQNNLTPAAGASDVVIPGGLSSYPVNTGTSYTIGNGRNLIVEPGAKVTFDVLTNNTGTLSLKSDPGAIASLLFNSYSDNGRERISMFLTGGSYTSNDSVFYRWHYIAVPSSMNKSVFTNVNPYNLLLFDDSKIIDSKMQGWQWHDGWDGTTGFTTLVTKRGYNFYHSSDVTINLPTVTGLLSTLGSTVPLQYNGDGLNLLGNSLTCSINWDEVIRTDSVRSAVYFTSGDRLATYNNGVGIPETVTGMIPPLQGFFVKALEPEQVLDFSGPNVKAHSNVNRYKSETFIPLVRLKLIKNGIVDDETVIRFDYNATTKFDNNFDASRLFGSSSPNSQLWSVIDNEEYVINAIPFPEEEYLLPLSLLSGSDGTLSIKRTMLTGLENYNVELIDNYQGFSTDLKEIEEYSFVSAAGTFDNRFILKITSTAYGLNDIEINKVKVNIYSWDNSLNIQPLSDQWSNTRTDINVYDITGRMIQKYTKQDLYTGSTLRLPFNEPGGIYIVEIISRNDRIVQKVSHR